MFYQDVFCDITLTLYTLNYQIVMFTKYIHKQGPVGSSLICLSKWTLFQVGFLVVSTFGQINNMFFFLIYQLICIKNNIMVDFGIKVQPMAT